MQKYFFYILLLVNILLSACSEGTNRVDQNRLYGNLLDYKQIGLGGDGSQESISLSFIQTKVNSIVCPNIESTDGLCEANKNYIESNPDLFNNVKLDNFIESNPLGIQNVKLFRISYTTRGQPIITTDINAGVRKDVSGLVIVPDKIESIQGIVLYYHPTVFTKKGVPSQTDSDSQLLLSALYASQGYILIAPDYIGQGIDVNTMHPYVVYPKINALSGLNMIKATRQFLQNQYKIESDKNLNLYITSYSEGGAYALWASRLLDNDFRFISQDNNVSLKKTVAIEGAYDLSGSMLDFAYAKVNNSESLDLNPYRASLGMTKSSPHYESNFQLQKSLANFNMSSSKIALTSYAFSAFVHYNYNDTGYDILFKNKDFLNNINCIAVKSYLNISDPKKPSDLTTRCSIQASIPELFNKDHDGLDENTLPAFLVSSAMGNTDYFTEGENVVTQMTKINSDQLVNNSVLTIAKDIRQDNFIMSLIRDADTWSYKVTTPTILIYMNYDSVVTSLNSIKACQDLNGVVKLSGGLANCKEVDAKQLYYEMPVKTSDGSLQFIPMMLDHSQGAGILQLIALQQILQSK
jgi:hypothetical protein